jgi:hypothetical protein
METGSTGRIIPNTPLPISVRSPWSLSRACCSSRIATCSIRMTRGAIRRSNGAASRLRWQDGPPACWTDGSEKAGPARSPRRPRNSVTPRAVARRVLARSSVKWSPRRRAPIEMARMREPPAVRSSPPISTPSLSPRAPATARSSGSRRLCGGGTAPNWLGRTGC